MKRIIMLASVMCAILCGCASTPPPAAQPSDALYRALGEGPGIERLVDVALRRIHDDLRINLFFENTDLPDLRRLLIEQICEASGGPCTYSGRSMEEAHSGMYLSEDDFAVFVEDLVTAMNEVGMAAETQTTVLGLFGPMKPQIIEQ